MEFRRQRPEPEAIIVEERYIRDNADRRRIDEANSIEDLFRPLRFPLSIFLSTLAMYWIVTTLITFAGPRICVFPGTESLEVCRANTTFLATQDHVFNSSADFDFAQKNAEILMIVADKYEDLSSKIIQKHRGFIRGMTMMCYDGYWRSTEPRESASTYAAHDVKNSLLKWRQNGFNSTSFIRISYNFAQNHLERIKKRAQSPWAAFIERTVIQPGLLPARTNYKNTLTELHAELTIILEISFQETIPVLNFLTAMEDRIEDLLQIATGNKKPVKRVKLSDPRYWNWILKSKKGKFVKAWPGFDWDAYMQACADFSQHIKEARKVVGDTYALLEDMNRTLGNLKEDVASDKDIWYVGDGMKESRLDCYLRVLAEGIEILEVARKKAKELAEDRSTKTPDLVIASAPIIDDWITT